MVLLGITNKNGMQPFVPFAEKSKLNFMGASYHTDDAVVKNSPHFPGIFLVLKYFKCWGY
jgi:hypothetical protein